MAKAKINNLSLIMEMLSITPTSLSQASHVDRTLITRWRNGERSLSRRSTQLKAVANAIIEMDSDRLLTEYLAPWRQSGESNEEALINHLVGESISSLRLNAPQTAGEYTKQAQVYFGHKGFHKAALLMLDYVQQLPMQREVRVLCQGRYDWLVGNIPFVLQFIAKLRHSVKREAHLLVVNRKGYSIAETAAFAGPWLLAHLNGHIRSLYYEGELPRDIRFLASIPGFWSGRAEEMDGVEDGLYIQTHTDAYDIRHDEQMFDQYLAISHSASQYGFLRHPHGEGENLQLWREGPLPAWTNGDAPDGSFFAMCRVPGFGLMTHTEVDTVRGRDSLPPLPDYLFSDTGMFDNGSYRLILCREDMQDGFVRQRFMHGPLSTLLGRRAFITKEMHIAQTRRLLSAMKAHSDFQVALVPRVAFDKLKMELVCWQSSVSVGWLQNMENSVFADDRATSGSFYGYLGFVWGKLLAGWKRQDKVARLLRKWLDGKELNKEGVDSANVRNWDVEP